MNDKLCDNCGHEKWHQYAFCDQCGHDNYENRKREAVEKYLGILLDMIHNIHDYVEFDSDYLDRDPDLEREIIEEAFGLIKHREHEDIEAIDWILLSPKGWYLVSPTDEQCEQLFEEATTWLVNSV